MPGLPIKPAVLTEIQRQLNHEWSAAHAYTALAVWCTERNLKGFAQFFYKQSGEEREHAQKFMDHLLDRGATPELSAIPAPRTKFKSVLEAAQHAREMEQANTAGIHQAYEAALANKDYPAQVALQWFISEQVEEEAWADELVGRVEAANCAGGMSSLDRHLEKVLSAKAHGGE